jgi:ATP-dependent Lon protease
MSITRLPVLFLTDLVVLPGMVVPIELDDAARAAVDTAKAHSDGSLLVAPRLEDRYASYGVVAEIVQLGRLATGQPAAVIKAERRVKIGSGVSGPGTALWVEAEELPETADDSDEIQKLAAEYKGLVIATLQRRDAWQVIDTVNRVTDPSTLADLAGYAPWLSDERKRQLLETPDVVTRLTTLIEWTKAYIAETEVNDKIADDVREGMEKSQREFLLRQQLNAIRKELGEDEPDGAQDYRARVEEAALPDEVRKAALREVGKLERAERSEPRIGLDSHLARHHP